jgi:DNA-binding CsgD family transcriptional regulator
MVNEGMLLRATNRVVSYIEKYVAIATPENKEEILTLFDNMHKVFPHWAIMTCPIMHSEISYVSQNASYVLGYDNNLLEKKSFLYQFFTLVHEADQADLYDCVNFIHDFMESIPPGEHHMFRIGLHYRFKRQDGQFIYLYDEKATLSFKPGNLYYGLFRDVTNERPFTGVKAEVYKQEITVSKIQEYKPSASRNPLSKREKELVTLIKQGLSTKEIAWSLNISHNTVRNIKSKLFEKYNVSNSIELLNMTG